MQNESRYVNAGFYFNKLIQLHLYMIYPCNVDCDCFGHVEYIRSLLLFVGARTSRMMFLLWTYIHKSPST